MKKQVTKVLLAASFMTSFMAISQENKIQPCVTYQAMEEYFSTNKEAKASYEKTQADFQKNYEATILNQQNSKAKTAANQYTIPVVFHILHMNGSENVSDAQVNAALAQVNADFAATGSDYNNIFAPFKALYNDADIRFVLARKDPQGNCTSGIIHRYDTRTNWDRNPPSSAGNSALYAGITWTSTTRKYLNVILVKDIVKDPNDTQGGQVIGYTWLPGTWATNAIQDAIVYNSSHLSGLQARSLSHEIGHWLNLPHTFGNTNNPGVTCSDDGVADTPGTKGNFSTCPASSTNTAFTCTSPNPANGSYYQNVENFMDYSACPKNFTDGQVTRMHTALNSAVAGRNALWTTNNLTLTDVNNVISCAPISEFLSANRSYTICAGSSLTFQDYSYNGTITSYQWTGNNGAVFSAPTASTTSASFPNIGVSEVTLTVGNSTGSNSSTKTITVIDATAGDPAKYSESFESGLPPKWEVVNNDVNSPEWEQTNAAALHAEHSFFIDASTALGGQEDYLVMPIIDVLNSTDKLFRFSYAYAQKAATHTDELRVQGSKDCGGTWSNIVVLSGSQMQSNSGGVTNLPFYPSTPGEWKTYTVSTHPGWNNFKTSSSVMVRFNFVEGSAGNGNNIFIDAIDFTSGAVGINELTKNYKYSLFPNPTSGETAIEFSLSDPSKVSVDVTDVLGRTIETLIQSNSLVGQQSLVINQNNNLPSGIYFVNLSVNGAKMTKKLVVE